MGDPNPLLFVDPSRGSVFSVGFGGAFTQGGRGGGRRGRGDAGAGGFGGDFGHFGDFGDGLPPFRNGVLSDTDDDSDDSGGGAGFGRGQAAARERRAQEQAQRRRAVRGPRAAPCWAPDYHLHTRLCAVSNNTNSAGGEWAEAFATTQRFCHHTRTQSSLATGSASLCCMCQHVQHATAAMRWAGAWQRRVGAQRQTCHAAGHGSHLRSRRCVCYVGLSGGALVRPLARGTASSARCAMQRCAAAAAHRRRAHAARSSGRRRRSSARRRPSGSRRTSSGARPRRPRRRPSGAGRRAPARCARRPRVRPPLVTAAGQTSVCCRRAHCKKPRRYAAECIRVHVGKH